jgi:glycosyltransferase involved in cell wall biosynthesis
MRVEFVTPYDHSPKTGIGRYMHTLKAHLEESIEVSFKPMTFFPLSDRFAILKNFPLSVKDHRPGSIVHVPQIMGCAIYLWKDYTPRVATVHDLGILETDLDAPLQNKTNRFILDLQLSGLKKSDMLLVHSKRTRDGLIRHLGIKPEAIQKVPSSIDSNHFRPLQGSRDILNQRYKITFSRDVSYLLYVGSELPRKNLKLLLEALSILISRRRKTKLIKVGGAGGDEWRAATLATAEAYGCLDDIIFPGIVSEDDLPHFYNAADISVTPTLLEGGFAWLAMESMGCGRPVVATVEALIPEEAREAALIVNGDDAAAFADAIEKLIFEPKLREEMGRIGRKVITAYTWEAEAACTINAYSNLLHRLGLDIGRLHE